MRSVFAFFGLVAILLLSSDSKAQFFQQQQPPGGQGGGFGGKGKGKGGGAEGGFGGGFGKGKGGFGGQGGFQGGGAQGAFPGGQGAIPGAQGGFQGGFQGGKGGGGFGKKGPTDPNQLFDSLARNRPFFLISEAPAQLRTPLMAFAKEKQLTSEQITRDQFVVFFPNQEQYRALAGAIIRNQAGGGGDAGAQKGGRGGNSVDGLVRWAENDFRIRDVNQDELLNFDEMPDALRDEVGRWDFTRDGLINMDEYKTYFAARAQQMADPNSNGNSNGPITILIDEDYDRRPDVIRAGKLPTNLPKWFIELDADQDGQVQLHEWYSYGKNLDEFKDWDRDDDKLVTAQEVLFKMKVPPVWTPTNGNRGPGGGFNSGGGDSFGAAGDNGFGGGFNNAGGKKGKGNKDFFAGADNGFGGGGEGFGGGKKSKGQPGGNFDLSGLVEKMRANVKGKGFGGGGEGFGGGGEIPFGGGKGKGKGKKGGNN